MKVLNIGVDDTDSKEGMCTTYIGAVIADNLRKMGIKIIDYPKLIRLNPNWKLKTRGNCAISIMIETENSSLFHIKNMVLETVKELAELNHETTNPGVVFFEGLNIPKELKFFSKKVIQDIVTIEEAEKIANIIGAEFFKFKIGRGIIGALAAIGVELKQDRTYELIAYRLPINRGTVRRLDKESVVTMNNLTYPSTFDNIDPLTGEIRITPHTPCPILYGIRAEDPSTAEMAQKIVKNLEPIERYEIYKTNQATDAHLIKGKISEIKPEQSFVVIGNICKNPKIIQGGHVIFTIKDCDSEIDCAAYEPTRKFREIIMKLKLRDQIEAYGGVKKKPFLPLTINLEKIRIIKLNPMFKKINPLCTSCSKRMKSGGKNKGFVCKKCKIKLPKEAVEIKEILRDVSLGTYEVPPRARRHLAKPLIRI